MKPLHLAPLCPHLSLHSSLNTCFCSSLLILLLDLQPSITDINWDIERDTWVSQQNNIKEANSVGGSSIYTWICVVTITSHPHDHLKHGQDNCVLSFESQGEVDGGPQRKYGGCELLLHTVMNHYQCQNATDLLAGPQCVCMYVCLSICVCFLLAVLSAPC